MRPPAWIRDHDDTQGEEIAAMAENFPVPEVMLSRIAALLAFDRRADLGRISAPALIVAARDDMVTPIYYSEELAGLIPGAETAILESGGHFFPISAAKEFRRTLQTFLAGTVRRAGAAE
jgi:aminoacrylate hydrolase